MYTFEAHFTPVRMNCQILRFFDADSPILGFFAVGFCNKSRGFSTKMTIRDEPKNQDVIGYCCIFYSPSLSSVLSRR